MHDDSPRALLRAALREVGYDAVGARSVATAMRVRPDEADRAPVRVIILDQQAVAGAEAELLARFLARHVNPKTLLLARATTTRPAGSYDRVLGRPIAVAEIAAAVEALLPIAKEHRHPIDVDGT